MNIDYQKSVVKAMGYHLMAQSSRLAFIQSRVSAESFVRNECALAASNYLADKYIVHMEKKDGNKIIDILIKPKSKQSDERYIFELKMAWPGGIGECSGKIIKDFESLKGRPNSWVIVLYFAFDNCPDWAPFGKRKKDFDEGLQDLINRINRGDPDCPGPRFQMGYSDVKGEAQLLGWIVK
mgnify:CR=1 FL=1